MYGRTLRYVQDSAPANRPRPLRPVRTRANQGGRLLLGKLMMEWNAKGKKSWRIAVRKPAGGFVFVRAEHLLAAWWAMREGMLSLYDLRVWLACHELVARRCQITSGRRPHYRVSELAGLVKAGREPQLRRAIRKLQAIGLLTWKETSIRLCPEPWTAGEGNDDDWSRMLAMVKNWRRKVPVPRRVLCHLAGCRRKVLMATVLGHLLRCVYYRDGKCVSGGRCKASWVASVFGVDGRNVKAARTELIGRGWLRPLPASQTSLNRWGLAVIVNLHHDFGGPDIRMKSPPPEQLSTAKSPRPYMNRELSTRYENQKPRQAGTPWGSESQKGDAKPDLRDIKFHDLTDPWRLDELLSQAVAIGAASRAPAARLRWFAAAERAVETATGNPCGFFAVMYRKGLWHHVSNGQEEQARIKLVELDYGLAPGRHSVDRRRSRTNGRSAGNANIVESLPVPPP